MMIWEYKERKVAAALKFDYSRYHDLILSNSVYCHDSFCDSHRRFRTGGETTLLSEGGKVFGRIHN